MWMHRIDITRAVGGTLSPDTAHDGRMAALVVRDLAEALHPRLKRHAALLRLTGAAGGAYQIGHDAAPTATIEMDALDFCILASGRYKAAEVHQRKLATISGATALGEEFIALCENRVVF
jgi:hypothetical protein